MSLDLNEINITTITGPPFVALILSWSLFGVLSIQVYQYFQSFPKDRPMFKTLVFGVYLLETVHTALLTETVWTWLASGFGNIKGLDHIGTMWLSVCCVGGLVALFVQCFYSYRIAVFSRNRIIHGFILLTSIVSFSLALTIAVYAKRGAQFTKLQENTASAPLIVVIGIWGGTGLVCDVAIASCMCYYLRKGIDNQYTTFSRTQALVSRLVRMTIETGVLTASVSILVLTLYYLPNSPYYYVPLSAHAKFYSTTMLAVINSRKTLGNISEPTAWPDSDLRFASVSRPREANGIRLNIDDPHSVRQLQNTNVFVTEEEAITTDASKQINFTLAGSSPL